MLFCIKIASIQADQTLSAEDARMLSPLFRMLMGYSEAGYVFYDKKPVCILEYSLRPQFFEEITFHDKLPVAITCAREVLERSAVKSENILFHFDETGGLLLIVNRRLFLETVKENLPLFQYVLGPSITPESLLTKLLSPKNGFLETLNDDKALTGIIL